MTLTELTENDIQILFKWINDKGLRRYSSSWEPVEWKNHVAWFNSIRNRDDVKLFGIRDGNRLVGTCQLTNIDRTHKKAELLIRVWDCDNGYGTSAVNDLVEYGFNTLNLNRIYLHVFSWNTRAIHVYKKCGFDVEGLLKKDALVDGVWTDQCVMARLR